MDIRKKIIEIIGKVLGSDGRVINDDTAIGDLPEWDSLHHLQIITSIEREFGFRFTSDVMMDLEDVSDIVAATEARVGR